MKSHNLNEYSHLFIKLKDGNCKWKIAIYVRLSKDDGNSVSLSIVNQIKKIARYLRNFEDFEIVDIYIDDGKTGTDFDRKDYIRLQQDVNLKIVNCIIVKDLTRYARNIADGIKELDNYVLEQKIRFISVGIPEIDTFKDPTQISSSEVYQALQNAEDFARITSKKVRDIKEIKREDGEFNGGAPPYGFIKKPENEQMECDTVAAEIVRKIFIWYAEGISIGTIAKKLNALGISNPTQYKKEQLKSKYCNSHSEHNSGLWWPQTIAKILTDKNYVGCSVQGKSSSFDHKRHKQILNRKEDYVIVPNAHEKIIDDDLFNKVQKIKSEHTRACNNNIGTVHLFANLVFCDCCNRAMKKTSSKQYNYLVCRTYKELGKEFCNAKRTINFKVLEDIVLKVIQTQINTVINLKDIIEKINQQPNINKNSVRLNANLENIKKEISKTEHIIDSAYIDWKNEDISKEQYQRIRIETEIKLEQLKETLQNIYREQQQIETGIQSNNEYFNKFIRYQNIEKLDRLMLIELINKIYIKQDKSVEIHFNYNNQYLLILEYIEQNKNLIEQTQKILKKTK